MDIDDFLEREVSDLGLPMEKSEKPKESLPASNSADLHRLLENIKADLSKGKIDEAEQSYVQLWNILLGRNLKWDQELYSELLTLNKQFSDILKNFYAEVKSKAEHITQLAKMARDSIREGKKDAFKLYSQIEEVHGSMPNAFFEEKRRMEEHVMELYKDLKKRNDDDLVRRVYALIHEIVQLIGKVNASLKNNDAADAAASYSRCVEVYAQIPEGFLLHKNHLGGKILELYKSLSISSEISNLKKQSVQTQSQQHMQKSSTLQSQHPGTKAMLLKDKKDNARKNVKKGLYGEASKDIEEVLKLEPNDLEAKAMLAMLKTLQ